MRLSIQTVPSEPLFSTHIQAMRGVEATPRQLLIAGRQVCSTVQGIHLSDTKPQKTSTQIQLGAVYSWKSSWKQPVWSRVFTLQETSQV